MFDLVDGLPLHPLVVHAVVVLLPLAVTGTIAIAVRPLWRRPYGPLVVAFATLGTALVPVATQSGEALAERVGEPKAHAELGEQLIWFALPMLVLAVVLVLLDRRTTSADPVTASAADARAGTRSVTVVAVLAVLAALACGVQVYRIGDSGARAVWEGRIAATR